MVGDLLVLAGLVAAADQLTKRLAGTAPREGHSVAGVPWVRIRRVSNAWGCFGVAPHRLVWLMLWVVAAGSLLLLASSARFFQGPVAWVGLGLLLGGATGNLVDRLWRGAVVDFIAVGRWPVFNLADVAIVAGAALALWTLVWTLW
jgi:signal peptidase II